MMSVVAGFVAGYLLANRSGRINFGELNESWEKIRTSEEVQDFVTGGTMMVRQVVKQGVKGLAGKLSGKK